MGLETIALVALAAGAVGGVGLQAAQAAGAFGKGGGGGGSTTIPLSPRSRALQGLSARLIAANVGAVPPTFAEFVRSGGMATFPLRGTELTPTEARRLDFVSRFGGQAIPFFDPRMQTKLTPEQVLFMGEEKFRRIERATKIGKKIDEETRFPRGTSGRAAPLPPTLRELSKLDPLAQLGFVQERIRTRGVTGKPTEALEERKQELLKRLGVI